VIVGVEKFWSRLYLEKFWFCVSGRGFDFCYFYYYGDISVEDEGLIIMVGFLFFCFW